jgi:protein-tyrosine phosphatase
LADEILERLWLGDANDAHQWPEAADALSVLEGTGPARRGQLWLPVLTQVEGRAIALASSLESISILITDRLAAGRRLLVHCGAGIERSPLAVAWHLVRTDPARWPTMTDAYVHIIARRPQVSDRQAWLERQP